LDWEDELQHARAVLGEKILYYPRGWDKCSVKAFEMETRGGGKGRSGREDFGEYIGGEKHGKRAVT